MGSQPSRRQFLQAGLALPAAGLVPAGPDKASPVPPAEYRTLGKTGLRVTGVGYGIGFVPVPEVVARALDMGINYYDTSRDYGDSEKIFSGVMKGRQRDKIVIATKSPSRRKADILKDLDTSLAALGTDYVDIWHLHARDTPTSIPDEAVEAMLECKKSGKARFVGFSCHDPNRMVDFVLETKAFDVVQTTYSFPIGGRFRDRAIERLAEAGVGIIAMKVVVALTGLNLSNFDNAPARQGEGPLSGIKWVLSNPAIGTTVPHMKTIPELEMNFRAMSEPYTAADEKLLYVLNERIRPDYCRMCYECTGKCPQGLPVTDILRYLAYHDFCGNYHQARMQFALLPPDIRSVRCGDCARCVIECPSGVHVRDRLVRAQGLLA